MEANTTTTNDTITQQPEYFRLPKTGQRDPYFGCSRSRWNQLILPSKANGYNPPIKTLVLSMGTARGCRLIPFKQAKQYFDNLLVEQNESEVGE
mgnify:CR=1 FL=1